MSTQLIQSLAIKCPKCQSRQSLFLEEHQVQCRNEDCNFKTEIICPLCNSGTLKESNQQYHCSHCKKSIKSEKLLYILNNLLQIDHQNLCERCGSPSTHRPDINLVHKCIFHPDCSGQNNLFQESQEKLVFLDFETSGLEIGRESIIEIGALKCDEHGIEHTFETFVAPIEPISPKIQNITGISNQMLDDAPTLKKSISAFADFIEGCTLVAHNANFDIPWLITALIRQGIELPFNKVICTLEWARKNKESQCSLGKLSKKYNIMHNNAHRALADAVTTKELFTIFKQTHNDNRVYKDINTYITKCNGLVEKYTNYNQD